MTIVNNEEDVHLLSPGSVVKDENIDEFTSGIKKHVAIPILLRDLINEHRASPRRPDSKQHQHLMTKLTSQEVEINSRDREWLSLIN